MERPTVDEWALGIAEAVSTRAECVRRRVGAVILNEHRDIVGAGMNGAPAGEPSCLDGACQRAMSGAVPGQGYAASGCTATHAEEAAINRAGLAHVRGCTLYVTSEPCEMCWPRLRGAGLARVVWPGGEWLRPEAAR